MRIGPVSGNCKPSSRVDSCIRTWEAGLGSISIADNPSYVAKIEVICFPVTQFKSCLSVLEFLSILWRVYSNLVSFSTFFWSRIQGPAFCQKVTWKSHCLVMVTFLSIQLSWKTFCISWVFFRRRHVKTSGINVFHVMLPYCNFQPMKRFPHLYFISSSYLF